VLPFSFSFKLSLIWGPFFESFLIDSTWLLGLISEQMLLPYLCSPVEEAFGQIGVAHNTQCE
jgi:hypothetical protein